ncbi:MAG: Maf family protein, partial [Candidatus Margulisiibacteriota bacterium]
MILSCLINRELVLASASPRRREILDKFGIPFNVRIAKLNEEEYFSTQDPISDVLKKISIEKAKRVRIPEDKSMIVGADTIVVFKDNVLGKPKDRTEAENMLRSLSGQKHTVMTGIAIIDTVTDNSLSDVISTTVRFKNMSDNEIEWYLQDPEYKDKAGAYGIQG